jgi:hypothetical protein
MELIETVIVPSGGATSIEFSSIAADWTDLYLVVSARDGDTGGAVIYVRPNGSSSNGTTRWLRGSGGASVSGVAPNIQARSNSGDRTADTFSSCSFYVPNYALSNYKSFSIEGVEENNSASAYMAIEAGLWSSTDAITSIVVAPGVGSFVEHSSASLYGISSGSDGTTTVG